MPGIRGWTEPRVLHCLQWRCHHSQLWSTVEVLPDVCKPLLRLSLPSPQVPRDTGWNRKSTELLLHLPLPSPHAPLLGPAWRPPGLGT